MDKIKIKNKGNPVFVGQVLCVGGGTVTEVLAKDLEKFGANQGGAFLLKSTISVFDEDLKRRQAAELNQAKNQAEAKVRQELGPVLEKEIRARLDKEYGSRIEKLKNDIDGLDATVADLKKQLKAAGKSNTPKGKEGFLPEKFDLDPERHHIEHRGAGKWFVMDQEEKVYGPLTDQEKVDFEERLKAE